MDAFSDPQAYMVCAVNSSRRGYCEVLHGADEDRATRNLEGEQSTEMKEWRGQAADDE